MNRSSKILSPSILKELNVPLDIVHLIEFRYPTFSVNLCRGEQIKMVHLIIYVYTYIYIFQLLYNDRKKLF